MSHVVATVVFKIKDGRVDDAIAALTETIVPTHDEAGCLNYALHQDNADKNTLVLVERWTSQVALESHMQQPYVAALGAKAADLLDGPPQMHFCTPIPVGDPMKGAL